MPLRRLVGASLIELLAVTAVTAILLGLLMPAVQAAREASRQLQCQNHLRQIGIAISNHESAHQSLPSGGWGFQWAGDRERGAGTKQPGGWIFSLLPHLENANASAPDASLSALANRARALAQPIGTFNCPSRRPLEPSPYRGIYPLQNSDLPVTSFKSDYAGCGGDRTLLNGPGPASVSATDLRAYSWPHDQATGVLFARSQIRLQQITDGLSHSYFVGEKFVSTRAYIAAGDRDFGDDQAALIGDDRDIRRWTEQPPFPDCELDAYNAFGSRHPSICNMLFGDGSVRPQAFTIDINVHRAQGNRHDGRSATEL